MKSVKEVILQFSYKFATISKLPKFQNFFSGKLDLFKILKIRVGSGAKYQGPGPGRPAQARSMLLKLLLIRQKVNLIGTSFVLHLSKHKSGPARFQARPGSNSVQDKTQESEKISKMRSNILKCYP